MKKKNILTLVLTLAMITWSQAQTVNWGNTPGDTNLQSDGTSALDGFHFELGTFTSGYDPLAHQPNVWGDDWITLDAAVYNSGAGYFSDRHMFTNDDYAGQQGYIFVYNDLTGTESSEWFMTTDASWIIPATGGGQPALPLEWRIFNSGEVLYGQKPGDKGPGDGTDPPGGYQLQTFTFVPEPGTSLLFGVLMSAVLFRRSRR